MNYKITTGFKNKFSNVIFMFGIFLSILIIMYGIYKIINIQENRSSFIYILCILFGSLLTILFIIGVKRFQTNFKFKFSIIFFLLILISYASEIYYEFLIKDNFNIFFGKDRFVNRSYYGESYSNNKNENNYNFFSTSEMNFIVINLGWEPSIEEVKWADKVLKTHKNHRAILVSHYILTNQDTDDFSNQGKQIYNSLKDNPNLFLMLSGHEQGQNHRTDIHNFKTGETKNTSIIHSLLSDFTLRGGGNGWLQILKFLPNENKIQIKTYSPFIDQYEIDENSEFNLPYKMNNSFNKDQSSNNSSLVEDFSIIVLPDTQIYSKKFPNIFLKQTKWIADNYQKLNIVYVAHVGDIVDDQQSKKEWINSNNAMMVLEKTSSKKFPDGIPFGIAPGNHDLLLKPKLSIRVRNVLKLTKLRIKFYAKFIQTQDH